MLPERVPIATPASGVKPIDVSIDFPPSTARDLHHFQGGKKSNEALQEDGLIALLHALLRTYGLSRGIRIYEYQSFYSSRTEGCIGKTALALFGGTLYRTQQSLVRQAEFV